MTDPDKRRFRLSSRVRFRRVDEEGVFVLQESGEVLVVNATGAKIVELLRDGQDLQGIAHEIAGDYALDFDVAQRDVHNIVDELVQAHALEVGLP